MGDLSAPGVFNHRSGIISDNFLAFSRSNFVAGL